VAHCVISQIIDTDGDGVVLACVVHAHGAPCPLNGQPASRGALHTDDRSGRDAVIQGWALRTHRQRTLVIHRGEMRPSKQHATGRHSFDCWCEPEVFPGE
jgi:hypothetical protein